MLMSDSTEVPWRVGDGGLPLDNKLQVQRLRPRRHRSRDKGARGGFYHFNVPTVKHSTLAMAYIDIQTHPLF